MSLPNTSLKTMSSAPPKKVRTWKKTKPHSWTPDADLYAPMHKNSFAKPAPAITLAQWYSNNAGQMDGTLANAKRRLAVEVFREKIWPVESRHSRRKLRWIWLYHNFDCHKLAPYAFSERKQPYYEYREITLPEPAETESNHQDPLIHNPPNQMPQEDPKLGSSTDFAVVIKDEPDVCVVKQERENTAIVSGVGAANESVSAVQPFHIPQAGFLGTQANLSEPQAGTLGSREDRILDTDSRPRQLILEEMAPLVSRYYELWAKLKSIHALEQIQKDVVQQPFPLQSLNMPAPMPGHQWHEHMNALGQSALPFLPPHPDPQSFYPPNMPITNAVSQQFGHSRSRQTVGTAEHKTAPCFDIDDSDDSDGCTDPVEPLDNGHSSVRSYSDRDGVEVSSSVPKQSSSTAKRRDKQTKDKHHSTKKRSHGDKSPERVNTNAPRHVKKKSIRERSVQSNGYTSSNNNASNRKRKHEDVALGLEGNTDYNSFSDTETSQQRKKGSAKVDERPSASNKRKTEERKVYSKSENVITSKETPKKKKKEKSSHNREHSQQHPKSKSPAVSRTKAKSEPPKPVKTEKHKPKKSKRADGREAYDSVHPDRRSLIESS
ncbi:hypothetical protein D6C84_04421 [Aureobasidium pullulans]|uniref:Uncharacterized protein n=1 Tax=Aureobasidium pullulans TaxID=5580 RepID=A0A4S9XV84_AURPU|nr:hypothetical protein D6C84_04421 [Aureobasidium pullulans]